MISSSIYSLRFPFNSRTLEKTVSLKYICIINPSPSSCLSNHVETAC